MCDKRQARQAPTHVAAFDGEGMKERRTLAQITTASLESGLWALNVGISVRRSGPDDGLPHGYVFKLKEPEQMLDLGFASCTAGLTRGRGEGLTGPWVAASVAGGRGVCVGSRKEDPRL